MADNLYVNEVWIDSTRHLGIGESGVYETFTDDPGELYRALQREYGRCISKVYIDGEKGETLPIGWVFVKRRHYEDTGEPYLAETWATLHERPPTQTTRHHYRVLGG